MRKLYTDILRRQFHSHLLRTRDTMGLTQEQMADRLLMASRTYVDLDHGKSCCGTLTFALYLIYVCPDPLDYLMDLRRALEEAQKAA